MKPGVWLNGVGRYETSRGVVWKIRYRTPLEHNSRRTKQVVETLVHCANRKQAESVLALRRAQVFDSTYRPRSNEKPVTVADFAPLFLDAKKELASHGKYKSQLDRHLLPRFGRKQLQEVTVLDCDTYRRDRIVAGAMPATVRNELRCLQSLFVEARRRNLVERDPVAGVAFGRIDNARKRLLSGDERDRLLLELSKRDDFLRPLFVLLYCTGMRLGDAIRMEWAAVDFDHGIIRFQQRKTGKWVFPPMHHALKSELERWRPICGSSAWVFPSPVRSDAPMSKKYVANPWRELLAAAKVENLWRHDLRRYVVTMLRAAGVGDGVIGSITGHESVSMIQRYDSPQLEQAREAVSRLPDLGAISQAQKQAVDDAKAAAEIVNALDE